MTTMTTTHYEYRHLAGHGRDDHMAGEIIARAARQLGMDSDGYIAAAAGLASHAVPLADPCVRLPSAPGVRMRMERALEAARREVSRRDCWIFVACVRTRTEDAQVVQRIDDYGRRVERRQWTEVSEVRRGREWVRDDSRLVQGPWRRRQ
jgi:hypothetical protein